ncbi:hypothetical protein OC844_003997 [Tilletia horrida]|nr:hypothetical protein OC844_003997 [Tilletia horrida]
MSTAKVHPHEIQGWPGHEVAPSPPKGVTTLVSLFSHQAELNATSPALSFQHNDDKGFVQLSYQDVIQQVRSTASRLRATHQQHPSSKAAQSEGELPVVGVWLERSLELTLSVLAATFSGATWLPFDADAPTARVTVCLDNARASVILTDLPHLARAQEAVLSISEEVRPVVLLYTDLLEESLPSLELVEPRPAQTAYMIYTSGTTGTPKGIAISHGSALIFVLSEGSLLGLKNTDTTWQGFSAAFDMWIEETWCSFAAGAHIAVGTREECRDASALGGPNGIWARRGVTILNAVPTLLSIMTMEGLGEQGNLPDSIRVINLGGEACPPALVSRLWRPSLRIWNTYGPTEATVTSTIDELLPDKEVTIGRPLPSYHALLLDIPEDDGSKAPPQPLSPGPGVEGELAVGGPCVGRGYVGLPEMTATKFIPHPFRQGERIYRTGDRVRMDDEGRFLFRGRIDTQVKHRGFRIELGEIENALSLASPDVRAASVILANEGTDAAQLEAWVVLADGVQMDVAQLRRGLSALPAYMHPEAYFQIAAADMPRLPSGKINAKGVKALSQERAERAAQEAAETAKNAPAEAQVGYQRDTSLGLMQEMFASVFPQAPVIQPEDDFFLDLGGHSLLCAILVSKCRKGNDEWVENPFSMIALHDLYECRTPQQLSKRFPMPGEKTLLNSPASASLESFMTDEKNASPYDSTTRLPHLSPEHKPADPLKHALCTVGQGVGVLFLFFLGAVEILVPYLIFDYLLDLIDGPICILAALGGAWACFAVIPLLITLLTIVAKWILLGRVQEGDHNVWGWFYLRWWFVERLHEKNNLKVLANSPLLACYYRALGAKIGSHCQLGGFISGASADLLTIGDDATIGADAGLCTVWVEGNVLKLRKIVIGHSAHIAGTAVIEGGAFVEDFGELAPLTMLPSGAVVPAGERWHGSPAKYLQPASASASGGAGEGEKAGTETNRPSAARFWLTAAAQWVSCTLLMPLLFLLPQIPGLLLFDYVEFGSLNAYWTVLFVAPLVTCAYTLAVIAEMIVMRWVLLPSVREGTYKIHGFFFLRKWLMDRIMDLTLVTIRPVFGTMYAVYLLRAIGVKIGHRAEVSTAKGVEYNLVEIGAESYVADQVVLGESEIRRNEITLKRTVLGERAFGGNLSVIPQGTHMKSDTLVGVLSLGPEPSKPLQEGGSCFGSPTVIMPSREQAAVGQFDDSVLFNPSRRLVALRLFVEAVRVILPRLVVVYGLGYTLQIIISIQQATGWVHTLLLLPAYYLVLFALPALLVTVALKWALFWRYVPEEWPLWSLKLWLSEGLTATFEGLLIDMLFKMLYGTPFLSACYRMLGAKIGKRVCLVGGHITEWDLVEVGDEACLNANVGLQTHLWLNRVLKLGKVTVGARASIRSFSIVLPDSSMGEGSLLASLSLNMKGEHLEAGHAYQGLPARPRTRVLARVRARARAQAGASRMRRGTTRGPGAGAGAAAAAAAASKKLDEDDDEIEKHGRGDDDASEKGDETPLGSREVSPARTEFSVAASSASTSTRV